MGRKKKREAGKKSEAKRQRKEQLLRERRRRRRTALLIAAGLAAAGALYVFRNWDSSPPNPPGSSAEGSSVRVAGTEVAGPSEALAQARVQPAARQAYLDELLADIEMSHCTAVVYDHDGSAILDYIRAMYESVREDGNIAYTPELQQYERLYRGGRYHVVTPVMFEEAYFGRKSTVFVGRQPFEEEDFMTDVEFRHGIGVHEARHCVQYEIGLGYLDYRRLLRGAQTYEVEPRVAFEIGELDANHQGLSRITTGEFPVNATYHRRVTTEYRNNRQRLQSVLPTSSPLQRELIQQALSATENPGSGS